MLATPAGFVPEKETLVFIAEGQCAKGDRSSLYSKEDGHGAGFKLVKSLDECEEELKKSNSLDNKEVCVLGTMCLS